MVQISNDLIVIHWTIFLFSLFRSILFVWRSSDAMFNRHYWCINVANANGNMHKSFYLLWMVKRALSFIHGQRYVRCERYWKFGVLPTNLSYANWSERIRFRFRMNVVLHFICEFKMKFFHFEHFHLERTYLFCVASKLDWPILNDWHWYLRTYHIEKIPKLSAMECLTKEYFPRSKIWLRVVFRQMRQIPEWKRATTEFILKWVNLWRYVISSVDQIIAFDRFHSWNTPFVAFTLLHRVLNWRWFFFQCLFVHTKIFHMKY